jgi:uncharacterized protein YdhG (YjbR/CyaY superfamily)
MEISNLLMELSIQSIDEYVAAYPPEVQERLEHVRQIVLNHAPKSTESISYGMPTYKMNGKVLLHFAAYKTHIGIYALPDTHDAFTTELANYKQGRGSVQFPLSKPLPLDLIERMVVFRLKEILGT